MDMSSSHPAAAVLASVLAKQGVKHAVVSPGSRNAPLSLALHHHPDIDLHVSLDERAAAHHALGMALATWNPVVVVCTSGTAAINHGPALAEAFHARIPLISITADRSAHSIGRGHGQTVVQKDLHAPHVVHSDELDETLLTHDELAERVRVSIEKARIGGPGNCAGPVHLNVPLEEPLYELAEAPNATARPTSHPDHVHHGTTQELDPELQKALTGGNVLVIAGPRPRATSAAHRAVTFIELPCFAEQGSQVKGPLVMLGAERLLQKGQLPEAMRPEAIVTLGMPPMSKALRLALSGIPHWHCNLEGEGEGWDIWGELKGICPVSVLTRRLDATVWAHAALDMQHTSDAFQPAWSDLMAWRTMVENWASWPLDKRPSTVFLANSASARYAQWVNIKLGIHPEGVVLANRGVAGIDGCTSTAVGWHAAQGSSSSSTWLVTGDLAFHYDANATLSTLSKHLNHMKIVVINNNGGGIFRWLEGTQHADAFEKLFETPPNRTVAHLAASMGARHWTAQNSDELTEALNEAANETNLAVVEILTPGEINANEVSRYLQSFHS